MFLLKKQADSPLNYFTGIAAFPCISALSVDSVLSEGGEEESQEKSKRQ